MGDAPATPYDPAQAAAAAASLAEAEAAEQEAEAEPEPEPEVAGLFTRPMFIGCMVTLSEGPHGVFVIVGLEDGGRSVRVRPLSGHGAARTVEQAHLLPVHPERTDTNVLSIFLRRVDGKNSAYAAGDRVMVCSVFGENVLITSAAADSSAPDDDESADMLEVNQLHELCKYDAQAAAEGDGEDEDNAPTKKKKKGKSRSSKR